MRSIKLSDVSGLGSQEKLMLIEEISNSKTLTKVELSHINLNNPELIDAIGDLIERSLSLNYLDLSWASLSASNLTLILESLTSNPIHIRHLDLSYNTL